MTITPELKKVVEETGSARIEDRETGEVYCLTKDIRKKYEDFAKQHVIPEGIQRSQDAFFRDLPELLKNKKWLGKWVGYSGDERVAIGKTKTDITREIVRRGIQDDQCAIFVIRPQERVEEMTYPGSWGAFE